MTIIHLGCAHESEKIEPSFKPQSEFFYSDFDRVWRATQIAISAYPLKVNNMEKGLLLTTNINSNSVFKQKHLKKKSSAAVKYNLKINLVKGRINGKNSVKVVIQKNKYHSSNFFSGPKELPSNGIEEKTILYSIKRELQVESVLDRASKNN